MGLWDPSALFMERWAGWRSGAATSSTWAGGVNPRCLQWGDGEGKPEGVFHSIKLNVAGCPAPLQRLPGPRGGGWGPMRTPGGRRVVDPWEPWSPRKGKRGCGPGYGEGA